MNFKKAKVVMLSHNNIDTLLTLYKTESGKPLHLSTNLDILSHHTNQHLYIISDDEIKEDDWYIDDCNQIRCSVTSDKEYWSVRKDYKKIIATTDTLLYNLPEKPNFNSYMSFSLGNPLPQPSQQFIQKFIEEYNKGNVITDVLVEYEDIIYNPEKDREYQSNDRINIEDCDKQSRLKINPKDNTITIKKVKDSWNREEVIKLLRDAHLDIVDGNYSKGLNKWIEENL